jgi:hypothetical protein
VGSAVNDATREAGGTVGVAVIGSVFTSLYARHLDGTVFVRLPHGLENAARNSVAAAFTIAGRAPHGVAAELLAGAQTSFMSGLHVACVVAAGVCWLGALGALALPGRRRSPASAPETLAASETVAA